MAANRASAVVRGPFEGSFDGVRETTRAWRHPPEGDLTRAGLKRTRFHSLPHCFATLAVSRLPLPTVQGYLGHAHLATTVRYLHHVPAADDGARLSAALNAGLGPIIASAGANLV